MNNPINNEFFDTRDLIEYRQYLEQELIDSYNFYLESAAEANDEEYRPVDDISGVDFHNESWNENVADVIEEYESIVNFCDILENNSNNFEYGETVIHEYYFTEYCKEFIKDCGYLSDNLPAIIENNIDWDGLANNMKTNYVEVRFDRYTYYIR